MGVFRVPNDRTVTFYKNEQAVHHFGDASEWSSELSDCRIDIPTWQARYQHECEFITPVIKESGYTSILELGSGPGELGQKILNMLPDLVYTFVDQPGASAIFHNRGYKGKFIVKDLMMAFDTAGLDASYDMIITNDFLEHIYNPSNVVQECYKLVRDGGKMIVSVPNWRMGHAFIYRGLFDYDNFVYFMYSHGFKIIAVADSPLKCEPSPKLSSESEMDERLITSWNWYMVFEKLI